MRRLRHGDTVAVPVRAPVSPVSLGILAEVEETAQGEASEVAAGMENNLGSALDGNASAELLRDDGEVLSGAALEAPVGLDAEDGAVPEMLVAPPTPAAVVPPARSAAAAALHGGPRDEGQHASPACGGGRIRMQRRLEIRLPTTPLHRGLLAQAWPRLHALDSIGP